MNNLIEFLQKEVENIAFYKVSPDESIIKSKILDSISIVDLAVAIEEETGIHISNTEINEEHFDSVNKIALFIEMKKRK